MEFRTLDGHELGQIPSYRGLVKCIRCRILRFSFEKGPRLPGSHPDREKLEKKCLRNVIFLVVDVVLSPSRSNLVVQWYP